jgi:15-cis-phytoene synthase
VTRRTLRTLEEPYRSRAVPPGTTRYWSWLFAAPAAREPLLGIYALMAEWHALTDPDTEADVARIKLAWWGDEMGRLTQGSPLHPICRYLANLDGAAAMDWSPLAHPVSAAAAQVAGVPVERAAELQSHADAVFGVPLLLAARLGGVRSPSVETCTLALAEAQYVARALFAYGREARAGRIVFPVDELLAAGVDNDDLAARDPPPRLKAYLKRMREHAARHFANAAAALAPQEQPPLRHLLVLAALGAKHLNRGVRRVGTEFRVADLYNAWTAARRAAAAR